MKTINVSVLFIFLLGCNNSSNSNSSEDLLPPVTEESSYSSFSKGSQNMVDFVYFNVVDTNASLTLLHNKIDSIEVKYQKWLNYFHRYQEYAEKFSSDANFLIQSRIFSDTTEKHKAKAMLTNFDEKHKKRTLQLLESKQRLEVLNLLLKDKIIVLKLAVTQPIINKKLDKSLPKNTDTKEIINEYESLLKQVDKEIGAQ